MLKRTMLTAGCSAVGCLLATSASAGVVQPGQSASGRNEDAGLWPLPDDTVWRGELLGEQSDTFEFIGDALESPDDLPDPAPFARGTFTSRVYRDVETGGLAFEYVLDQTEHAGVIDLERVSIRSFQSFVTDAYFSNDDHNVSRSADGASLDYLFNIEDVDGRFLVRTDAEAFNANGSFFVAMDFEPDRGTRNDTFAAFQPTADDPGPTPNPIPLPPAAWAAVATVGAFGAGGKLRRRLRR